VEYINITDRPPMNKEPLVLCLGKFDGLHRGHQYLLNQAQQLLAHDDQLAVWTYKLHASGVDGQDGQELTSLTPLTEKRSLLASYGVQKVYEVQSTGDLAAISLETFVHEQLSVLNVRHLVVGEEFNIGKASTSDIELLKRLCSPIGIGVTVVPLIQSDGRTISSTYIGELIRTGDIGLANELLGRPYTIKGIVAHGNKIGRTLGFPTANMDQIDEYVEPSPGVYRGVTEFYNPVNQRMESWNCLISAGYRPTVGGKTYKVEAYLMDFSGDLYRQTISVAFVDRLRGEVHFPSLDALIVQMHADERQAREAFGMPAARSVR